MTLAGLTRKFVGMKLDKVDIELIRLLQKDSKKTTKQYADAFVAGLYVMMIIVGIAIREILNLCLC